MSIAPPLPAPAGLRQSRKGNSREGNAEGNSVQSIFLKETRGKETSACPGGGQQVAENGGNERAVPIERASASSGAGRVRVVQAKDSVHWPSYGTSQAENECDVVRRRQSLLVLWLHSPSRMRKSPAFNLAMTLHIRPGSRPTQDRRARQHW